MIKVSVIIPVYNGEAHLRQCLDSVCGQTLQEIEIICVDDGSTDSSFEILQEYQKKDERIRLFRQQNLYAGAARNRGKANARGACLIFWDCDDFFEPNALEVMYEQISTQNADICVCRANHYVEDTGMLIPVARYMNKKRIPAEPVFNRQSNENYILNFTNAVAWNKMYRRAFIEALNLDFQCIRNGNDIYFTICAMCLADRITTVDQYLINYRVNQSQSLVGTLTRTPLIPFRAWIDTAKNLEAHQALPERSFANKTASSTIYLLRNIQEFQAFRDTVQFLKDEGLKKLHLIPREEGYYYNPSYNLVITHLIQDDIQDFQTFLSYLTYTQLVESGWKKQLKDQALKKKKTELSALKKSDKAKIRSLRKKLKDSDERYSREIARLQARVDALEQSHSYRVGQKVLWLPSQIKKALKK